MVVTPYEIVTCESICVEIVQLFIQSLFHCALAKAVVGKVNFTLIGSVTSIATGFQRVFDTFSLTERRVVRYSLRNVEARLLVFVT